MIEVHTLMDLSVYIRVKFIRKRHCSLHYYYALAINADQLVIMRPKANT